MVVVVDYGLGNIRSVSKALEKKGATVKVTSDASRIKKAQGIVLPGVGAFYRGMENLKKLKIIDVLKDEVEKGKPFLGICLGLQLLFSESEEHTKSEGLNIIKGTVTKFSQGVKIPHMGWNQIQYKDEAECCQVFNGIQNGSYFYFVHSYFVVPQDKSLICTTTSYGEEFTSSIMKDNIYGVQFHPEKSQAQGLKILDNFLNLIR